MAKTTAQKPDKSLSGESSKSGRKTGAPKIGTSTLAQSLSHEELQEAAQKLAPDPGSTFLLHRQYDITQDRRRLRVSLRGHWLVALVTVLVAVITAVLAYFEGEHLIRISQDANARALITIAQVISRRHEETPRRLNDRWFVSYQFTLPDGRSVEGEAEISEHEYLNFADGAPVMIKYLPETPIDSVLAYQEMHPPDFEFLIILIGLAIGTVLVVIGYALVVTLRNRRYERQGVILRGEVVSCEGKDRGASYFVTTRFKFKTLDGREIVRELSEEREDLRRSDLPKPGASIAVLYVTDRMYKLL